MGKASIDFVKDLYEIEKDVRKYSIELLQTQINDNFYFGLFNLFCNVVLLIVILIKLWGKEEWQNTTTSMKKCSIVVRYLQIVNSLQNTNTNKNTISKGYLMVLKYGKLNYYIV